MQPKAWQLENSVASTSQVLKSRTPTSSPAGAFFLGKNNHLSFSQLRQPRRFQLFNLGFEAIWKEAVS